MPRGSKSKYSSKQKRKAEHIEEGYEKRGTSKKEAERPRGPIPTKFTGRSFTLDDEKDAVGEDVPDIDNFATSQPEDKKEKDEDADE